MSDQGSAWMRGVLGGAPAASGTSKRNDLLAVIEMGDDPDGRARRAAEHAARAGLDPAETANLLAEVSPTAAKAAAMLLGAEDGASSAEMGTPRQQAGDWLRNLLRA